MEILMIVISGGFVYGYYLFYKKITKGQGTPKKFLKTFLKLIIAPLGFAIRNILINDKLTPEEQIKFDDKLRRENLKDLSYALNHKEEQLGQLYNEGKIDWNDPHFVATREAAKQAKNTLYTDM